MQREMQMNSIKTTASIEFLVDETNDVLLGHEKLPNGVTEEILRLPLSNIREREPAEIQRTLGRLVLSFLNSHSSHGLKLPRDLEDAKTLDEKHFAQLRADADSSKPQAIYDLAVGLIASGMTNKKWTDIEQGERLLEQAIASGLPAAITYRDEVWSLVRPRLVQSLKPS
jgi:hypothetical protein